MGRSLDDAAGRLHDLLRQAQGAGKVVGRPCRDIADGLIRTAQQHPCYDLVKRAVAAGADDKINLRRLALDDLRRIRPTGGHIDDIFIPVGGEQPDNIREIPLDPFHPRAGIDYQK